MQISSFFHDFLLNWWLNRVVTFERGQYVLWARARARACVCVCVCSHLPALPVRAAMWRSDTVGTLSSVSWFSCSVFELHWIKDVFLFVCSCDHITFTVNRPWLPFKSVFSSFLSFLLEAPGLCLVSHHYCCSSVFPPVRSVSEEERSEHKKNQRLESFVGRIFFYFISSDISSTQTPLQTHNHSLHPIYPLFLLIALHCVSAQLGNCQCILYVVCQVPEGLDFPPSAAGEWIHFSLSVTARFKALWQDDEQNVPREQARRHQYIRNSEWSQWWGFNSQFLWRDELSNVRWSAFFKPSVCTFSRQVGLCSSLGNRKKKQFLNNFRQTEVMMLRLKLFTRDKM